MSGLLDDVRNEVAKDKIARATDGWDRRCQVVRKQIADESQVDRENGNPVTHKELAVLLEACTTYVVTSDASIRGKWQDDLEYWRRAIVYGGGEVDEMLVSLATVLVRTRCKPLAPTDDYLRLRLQELENLVVLMKSRLGLVEH